jgi:membrane-bound metal-dependent hydrolase YbcI (DUF457 family)
VEGTTHAATGLLLGAGIGLLTTGPLRGTGTVHDLAIAHAVGRDLLFGAVTAGMALLPDADHPDATFAYSAGAVSHGISHLVAVAFGGHRQGMHSLVGIAFWSAAAEACAVWWPNRWALGFLAAFIAICVVAGLKATGFMRHGGRGHRSRGGGLRRALAGCGIAALAVTYARADLWWLVALGMALHILEDEFTGHGCALLWPISRKRFGGDGRQPAGSRRALARKPRSGYSEARDRALRPVAASPARKPRLAAVKPTCPACWMGECSECKDRGCGCPEQGPDVHQLRPKRRAAVPATAEPLPPPEEDIPPY